MDRTVRTYESLRKFAAGFASGNVPLLVVHGPCGTGKTTAIKAAVSNGRYIEGHITPIELFATVYEAEDAPVVLDDVDGFLRRPGATGLLKAICQTERKRRVSWLTSSSYLEEREVPTEYETSSPICILANEWSDKNPNMKAIGDRGFVIYFDPTPAEIHAEAGRHVEDKEVYDYIGTQIGSLARLSLRDYRNSVTLKSIGEDWRSALLASLESSDPSTVLRQIQLDPKFSREADRVVEFKRRTGMSRASYFRLKSATAGLAKRESQGLMVSLSA